MINNADVLVSQWKQLRGKIKDQWGAVTDNDLAKIDGKAKVLIGVLQERYARTRPDAEAEVERFLRNSTMGASAGAKPGLGRSAPLRAGWDKSE